MGWPERSAALNELSGSLVDEIETRGPITFARFMRQALYDRRSGYYSKGGAFGVDFHTSPTIHPVFGSLLARQACQCWQALDNPPRFDLVEIGAGDGSLAASLLAELRSSQPLLYRSIHYRIVERSPALRRIQRNRLASERVEWGWPNEPKTGLIIANELFDALPVHLVVQRGDRLVERYVTYEGGFREIEGEPSRPGLSAYFRMLGINLPDGYRTEVNLEARPLLLRMASILRRGWAVVIDYGYPAQERYGPSRSNGSVQCYHGGSVTDDPYARIGDQDITTHVDFTALALWAEKAGLRPLGLVSQRSFLRNLGLDAYIHGLDSRLIDFDEKALNQDAMRQLVAPGGLGRFLVLGLASGDVPSSIDGFGDNPRRREAIEARSRIRIPLIGGGEAPVDEGAS